MKKIFSGKVWAVLAAALVIAVSFGIGAQRSDGSASFFKNAVNAVLSPFRATGTRLADGAERYYNYLFDYERLSAENQALKEQIASMEEEIRNAEEMSRENDRLRELLGLSVGGSEVDWEDARVTSWDGSGWSSGFLIDRGSEQSLEAGMCVVDSCGYVVGFLTEVGGNWSRVMTILDPNSQIGAVVGTAGYSGVAQGRFDLVDDGKLLVNYLDTDAAVRNGDTVLTAGNGDLYPSGLVIGSVSDMSVDISGANQSAVVTASADFSGLEQVFVIVDFSGRE